MSIKNYEAGDKQNDLRQAKTNGNTLGFLS